LYDTPSTVVEYAEAALYNPSLPVLYEAAAAVHGRSAELKAMNGDSVPPAPASRNVEALATNTSPPIVEEAAVIPLDGNRVAELAK
jgi:hypothetical protein